MSPADVGVTPTTQREFHVADNALERLDLLVARACEISRTQAATLIANGHVTVNGKAERASYRGEADDRIAVTIPPPPGRDILPESIPLSIAYEDDDLVVVDKVAGMV
ncbi:MAG: S4 domain-containing protein, partial [Gemmatimonas sp.]